MIPIGTDRELEGWAPATIGLIAANLAVFILQIAMGWDPFSNPLALNPEHFQL